jgi:hypothetical protein
MYAPIANCACGSGCLAVIHVDLIYRTDDEKTALVEGGGEEEGGILQNVLRSTGTVIIVGTVPMDKDYLRQ